VQLVDSLTSLREHCLIRMRDGDLLTSKENGYWHYMFDLLLNSDLNHCPSALILNRGVEILIDGEPMRQVKPFQRVPVESQLPMDDNDATRRIKELASLLKKGPWTYFITLTVNDSETPGIREITRAIKNVSCGNYDRQLELTDSYLPFALRAWERFVRVLLQQVVVRNDCIIGRVKSLFYRYEFQGMGSRGNKPHVHCGVTLEPESANMSAARICCCSTSFHSSLYGTDYESLAAAGIVSDVYEYERWQEIVSCVNHHDCRNSEFRCAKVVSVDGTRLCRYHRQPPLPLSACGQAWFQSIDMPYNNDVNSLLESMNLACKNDNADFDGHRWILDDSLAAGKWHYPARQDEFFLASIPLLSAICRSATNVDMCDRKFQVSYLIKYICGKEEHQLVDVSGTKDMTEVNIVTADHRHEKITGCNKLSRRKQTANRNDGREICLPEIVWYLLHISYTYTNAHFVHVHTVPLENRAAVRYSVRRRSSAALDSCEEDPAIIGRIRANLPQWRQFSDSQRLRAADYRNSPFQCDATSSFNVRPPELMFFDSLQVYAECFVNVGKQTPSFHSELHLQPWYDGLSRRVKLRSTSIDNAVAFVMESANAGSLAASQMLASVFDLMSVGDPAMWKLYRGLFDVHSDRSGGISLVKPWDVTKFLTHVWCTVQSAVMADVEMQHEKRTENQGQPPQPTDDEREKLGVGIADLTAATVPRGLFCTAALKACAWS
jgi:hypothetical protein